MCSSREERYLDFGEELFLSSARVSIFHYTYIFNLLCMNMWRLELEFSYMHKMLLTLEFVCTMRIFL